jgi:hypothetical protein
VSFPTTSGGKRAPGQDRSARSGRPGARSQGTINVIPRWLKGPCWLLAQLPWSRHGPVQAPAHPGSCPTPSEPRSFCRPVSNADRRTDGRSRELLFRASEALFTEISSCSSSISHGSPAVVRREPLALPSPFGVPDLCKRSRPANTIITVTKTKITRVVD